MGKGSPRASRSTKKKKPNVIALVRKYGHAVADHEWAERYAPIEQVDRLRGERDDLLKKIRAALKEGGW